MGGKKAATTTGGRGAPESKKASPMQRKVRGGHRGSIGSNPFSSKNARTLAKQRGKSTGVTRSVSVKIGRGVYAKLFGKKEVIDLDKNATQAAELLGSTCGSVCGRLVSWQGCDVWLRVLLCVRVCVCVLCLAAEVCSPRSLYDFLNRPVKVA